MKYILCISILLFFLTSCNENDKISEGTVFKKEYKSASTELKRITRTRVRVRRSSSTTITTNSHQKVSYPNRWIVYVHSADAKDSTCFFVRKEVYDTIEVGSWFVFDTVKGTLNEPCKVIEP